MSTTTVALRRCLVSAAALSTMLTGCAEESAAPDSTVETEQIMLASDAGTDRYIVAFRNARGRAAVENAGGRVALDLPNHGAVAVYLPEQAVAALGRNPNIEFVEPDARRYPTSEVTPYGISMVQGDAVTVPPGTARVPVCVIDSGIMGAHEDFAGLPISGSNTNTAPWSTDLCGHGTHVAGTIAAVAGNGVGVVGVAPDAVGLHIVKVFGDDCGWTYSSSLIAAVDLCVDAGARVVSMSLGGTFKSKSEERAFDRAYDNGVLSIAAAGNDGNNRRSYPASYPGVVSVAAVDAAGNHASFSQYNAEVEVAAPGVAVLSTYPVQSDLTVGGVRYAAEAIEYTGGSGTGALVNGGLCTSAGSWSGAVVLCERGEISFADKVANVWAGGGAAAVIYNNEPGSFAATLGAPSSSSVPSVSISQADGQALVAGGLGLSATVNAAIPGPGYASLDGTSMATPHVAGVAALVWSLVPGATNAEIRNALAATAFDLGPAGRDDYTGYGLVQAQAALDYLGGSTDPGPDCSTDGVCNAECAEGEDADCVVDPGPDCSTDGVCNAECAEGEDADCVEAPVCSESGSRCFSDAECCSGACVPARRGNRTVCG